MLNLKNDLEPDGIVDAVLTDAAKMLDEKYGKILSHSTFFNINRMATLLGSQFSLARQAIQEGYVIQDCEICTFWDKTLPYCQYYKKLQTDNVRTDYYYQSLCPALRLKC